MNKKQEKELIETVKVLREKVRKLENWKSRHINNPVAHQE